jgi:hypothetical protein
MDAWSPDGSHLVIKLIDAGPDKLVGTADDSTKIIPVTLAGQSQWIPIDLLLSDFAVQQAAWTGRNVAQIVIALDTPAAGGTLYVDNLYFYKAGGAPPTAPTTAPTRPTEPAATVISLLSDAYTNVAVDTWRTGWSNATLTDVMVGADHVKEYSALDFVGIETTTTVVNASAMNFVHFDAWTPSATTFRLKLVDFGANGIFGGGDDSEHELAFTSSTTPALVQGSWVSFDLPLSSFTGLLNRAHLGQYIFSALPTAATTVYIDNFYFHQ